MTKVTPIIPITALQDRKRRKQTKEDFRWPKGKGPEPPKGA